MQLMGISGFIGFFFKILGLNSSGLQKRWMQMIKITIGCSYTFTILPRVSTSFSCIEQPNTCTPSIFTGDEESFKSSGETITCQGKRRAPSHEEEGLVLCHLVMGTMVPWNGAGLAPSPATIICSTSSPPPRPQEGLVPP